MKDKDDRKREKMLLSSRASPPKPLSSLSQKNLSVKQLLLYSPIPSPALPALLPRHGKKPPPLNTRKALRVLAWLAILTTLYYIVSFFLNPRRPSLASIASIPYLTSSGKTYQIVGDSDLPDFATPLAVTDSKGRHRWTVSIPEAAGFPLSGVDYADICLHIDEVAGHVKGKKQKSDDHHAYYHADPNFIDVEEAQAQGLLPPPSEIATYQSVPVCQKSLTYVLDTSEAGFGALLLGMWLSYSLAQEEGRAFFLDDSTFAYGKYSTYFSALLPVPECRPPPRSHRVPCPHHAKHIVISPATHAWNFGEEFRNHRTRRQIFDMARSGYEALFDLRQDDGEYAQARREELKHHDGEIDKALIGIHLRRGDRHPFDFAYQLGYLPPSFYREAAQEMASLFASSKIILASDDPEMYTHGEMSEYTRAQERITLASGKALSVNSVGWEGGFFKDLFWDLGLPLEAHEQRKHGSPMPTRHEKHAKLHHQSKTGPLERDYRSNPTNEARTLREFIGRAYLLELSILGHSDRVVCAVSSYTCRILAVMMGWERAFEKGHWKNVDGHYDWRALDV
jgi:hypothetical protein